MAGAGAGRGWLECESEYPEVVVFEDVKILRRGECFLFAKSRI